MPTAPATPPDPLHRYWTKRDFGKTPEPRGVRGRPGRGLSFVVQKHDATRLHYDFRLELDGVLLSWAVPKGPSFDPADKRMAVRTEDHPLSYAGFEGTIPRGQYGAGTVIVWDRGRWVPAGDPHEGLKSGKLQFVLHGEKLAGSWELVRLRQPAGGKETWLLFKKRDAHAQPRSDYDVVSALPDSVLGKRSRPKAAVPAPAAANALPGLQAAPRAPLPDKLSPQLATLSSEPPTSGEWLYEVKFDGYRVMTRIEHGVPRLITRGGHDWTPKMHGLAQELKRLKLDSAWLDGEIVAFDADGTPDFNALQNAFDRSRTAHIVYFLFDLPYLTGHDLRSLPLSARRQLLQQLMAEHGTEHLRFSAAFEADAATLLESACRLHLEGVIAKRADAPYESRRSHSWLKLKCQRRQEFVIGGFTDRSDGSPQVGSLLLGVHDDQGALIPVGSVGTGWDRRTSEALRQLLAPLETRHSPFDTGAPQASARWARRSTGNEHWVKPKLVAEASFAEWTPDGQIRHAVFIALRTDKAPREITREKAIVPVQARAPAKATGRPGKAQTRLSHPERVVDPRSGLTKLDLARYYESVAGWILPHLAGRPCSLMRAPSGITGELFFQKHAEALQVPGARTLDPTLWPGHAALLEIDSLDGLRGAAQMNVVEFHTWNARSALIGKPDRMVFDIDPGEGVGWAEVRERWAKAS
jgi:bifunctional non-homologous end joining protein LigD